MIWDRHHQSTNELTQRHEADHERVETTPPTRRRNLHVNRSCRSLLHEQHRINTFCRKDDEEVD